MKNIFLVRFWRGDIKLWISYWICGVLFQYAIGMSDFYIAIKFNTPVGIIIFPFVIFWCLGTWRAAKKYTGRPLWATLTKFTILINALLIIFALVITLGL